MPNFGAASLKQRATLDPRLQRVLDLAITFTDFKIVEGHRGKTAQDKAVAEGKSQTPWPTSKHNSKPSRAADLAPYPVDWSDTERAHLRFAHMMGVVDVCAQQLGVTVRFGWRWKTLVDLPHVELAEP